MPGFDITDFSGTIPSSSPAPKVVQRMVAQPEEDEDEVFVEDPVIDSKENTLSIGGHEIKRRSNSIKSVSTERGLLKEMYSKNPQVNPLPDEVVDKNIKAGII